MVSSRSGFGVGSNLCALNIKSRSLSFSGVISECTEYNADHVDPETTIPVEERELEGQRKSN